MKNYAACVCVSLMSKNEVGLFTFDFFTIAMNSNSTLLSRSDRKDHYGMTEKVVETSQVGVLGKGLLLFYKMLFYEWGKPKQLFVCVYGFMSYVLSLTALVLAPSCITCAILSLIPDFCISKSPECLVLHPVFSNCRLGKQQHVLQMALSCTFAEWQLTDQTEPPRVERIRQPCVLIYISDLQNTGKSQLSCPFGWWGLIIFIKDWRMGRDGKITHSSFC